MDINDDPEVWEFTDTFGDRASRTWDEVLSILERTQNRWRLAGDWSVSISRKVRQTSANVRRQVDWMVAKGWLLVDERSTDGSPLVLSARNHWKFHKREEHKAKPSGNDDASPQPTNQQTNQPKDAGETPALSKNSIPEWETSVVDLMAFDPRRFERLDAFVGWAKGQKYRDAEIALGLSRLRDAVRKDLVAGDWWGYARVLLQKAAIDVAEQEHEQRKREEREFATLTLIAPRKADA